MSKGDVMSERDNSSIGVVVSTGVCCRVRRTMQCFGLRGNKYYLFNNEYLSAHDTIKQQIHC